VIKALGDRFDFLAYYSDFRIDNQEAGTPSDGPLGGNVTGIGPTEHDLESYCGQGRFQWGICTARVLPAWRCRCGNNPGALLLGYRLQRPARK
jgi:hypothetical protein